MFFLRKNKEPVQPQESEPPQEERSGWLAKLKAGLDKTRKILSTDIQDLLVPHRKITQETLETLEERLLMADVGVAATQRLIDKLQQQLSKKALTDGTILLEVLASEMEAILAPRAQPWVIAEDKKPYVILMVGVNGSGKTTTIGKLSHQFKSQGKNLLLAAGDTFRAAAIEQLQALAHRESVPVVAQQSGADSASVLHDAFQFAKTRNLDILLADTAGRLHNKGHLMEELKKIKRVLAKLDPTAPHEILLVIDATSGQNGLIQAREFHQAMGATGIILTKLDGTAKGGIIFAIAQELDIAIRFIGIGEKAGDLRPFDPKSFVQALLEMDSDPPAPTP